MAREYVLRHPAHEPRVLVEHCGKSLRRVQTIGGNAPRGSRRPNYLGHECRGRKQSRGWTAPHKRAYWRLMELHGDIFRGFITVILPRDSSARQVELMRGKLRMLFFKQGVASLGCIEGPLPHFHIASEVSFSTIVADYIEKRVVGYFVSVFKCLPPENAIHWGDRNAPPEWARRYMMKVQKHGVTVKGSFAWLACKPYWATHLPSKPIELEELSEREASAVLHPSYKLSFGAAEKLANLRKEHFGHA